MMLLPNVPDFYTPKRHLTKIHQIEATSCTFTIHYQTLFQRGYFVNIRLTHPKKSAVEHRVIIELGVIRQEAPATLAAGSDPGGQANATRTPLATAEFRHGPLV